MATDLNKGPWPDVDTALEEGGEVIKAACREAGGSLHGYVAVSREDGQYGVRGCYSTRHRNPLSGRTKSQIHYVKAGIDDSCKHPKRYT